MRIKVEFWDYDPYLELNVDILKNHPHMVETFEKLQRMTENDELDEYLEAWK